MQELGIPTCTHKKKWDNLGFFPNIGGVEGGFPIPKTQSQKSTLKSS